MNMNDVKTNVGGIAASAVLVDVSISLWVGRKIDKGNTDKVVADNHAKSKDAALVTKKLFVDNPKLDAIVKFGSKVRKHVADVSLPWMGDLRILPITKFMDFQEQMAAFEQDFSVLVQDFLLDYDLQISAMAFKLGSLFDRSEYPTKESIAHKFKLAWSVQPLPTSGHFLIDAENDLKEALKASYEEAASNQMGVAMKQLWGRLKECLERMSDRLDVVDGKGNVFRDTLLSNALELIDILNSLNLTGDPDMREATMQLEQALRGVEADELRKNEAIRSDVKASVDAILSSFQF